MKDKIKDWTHDDIQEHIDILFSYSDVSYILDYLAQEQYEVIINSYGYYEGYTHHIILKDFLGNVISEVKETNNPFQHAIQQILIQYAQNIWNGKVLLKYLTHSVME